LFAAVAEKRRQSAGPDHPLYASSLTNLAAAEESLGEPETAERHFAEALSIRKQALGPQHPDVAGSLANLATLLRKRGQPARAKEMLEQALEIRARALGRWHPDYAVSLNNLAVHHRECQDYAAAASWYRQALAAQQAFIEATLPALAEQQQITLLQAWRRTLDGYLSIASPAGISADEAYAQVLWWKGRALAGQLRRRSDGKTTDPRLAHLQRITGELAALAVQAAGDENLLQQRRLLELAQERERLEAELAATARGPAIRSHFPQDVAAALPPGVVLVDFLEYERSAPAVQQAQTELTAFVVRRDAPIVRLNLGPASEIRDLVAVWRRTCGAPGQGEDAGRKLRQRVWLPLARLVGQAAVVLVSPDGCLTRLPLAALPGDRAGSYLLEERAFVVAAVPQLLPQLLARPKAHDAAASLLLVGDIDYGKARQSRPDDSLSTRLLFERLPAARGEILAVRDSFERAFEGGSVTMLRQSQAGEAAFRRAAARHRFIHVVTHGFASESPLPPFAPGLSAGLAFAGANDPSGEGLDDGLLTACEMAGLDLRGCELVVLSACESALGEVAGGEGVLGLQRSCQMAGARSAVASLWKVDDEATRRLMELFYERLCSADAPTSRAEALRQAQLAMLRGESQRGLGIVSRTGHEQPRRGAQAWAAFTLSGDWR
jgi:CHAT domain-containing protein